MGNRIFEIKPVYVDEMPRLSDIQPGILYICEKYHITNHLCACGCGISTPLPLGDNWWSMSKNREGISITPSIGNWRWEAPNYHAHYFITENKIIWC